MGTFVSESRDYRADGGSKSQKSLHYVYGTDKNYPDIRVPIWQRFEILVQYNKQCRAHPLYKRVILGTCSPDPVLPVTRKVCLGWRLGYRFYNEICSYTLLMHEGSRAPGLDLVDNLQRKRSVK